MKNTKKRDLFDSIDFYGGSPNQFTIKGRTNLHSNCGVACSLFHTVIILIFACLKLTFVASKYNPSVAVFEEGDQHQTKAEAIDMNAINFKIAIMISDMATGETLHDKRFVDFHMVKWQAVDGGLVKGQEAELHPCTEKDYDEFYPRPFGGDKFFDKNRKAKTFMCLNELDKKGQKIDYKLFGVPGVADLDKSAFDI
jgi:hypothetical protein